MNRPSLTGRPGRLWLVLLALVSGLSTAVILADAFGASPVQQAVVAAARARAVSGQRAVVLAEAALRSTSPSPSPAAPSDGSSGAGGGDGGGSGGGSVATPAPAATPSPVAPTPASSTTTTSSSTPSPTAPVKATVSHLFEIVLSSSGYDATFGPEADMPYLHSLVTRGTELSQYHSLGRGSLADELALVSGQPPNADTSTGCSTYAEFPTSAGPNSTGVVSAAGCVYPETVITLGDQVSSAGHQWRAYVTGMGRQACLHPNSNAADSSVLTGADVTYDTRQNPFIYFHSLLDLGDCSTSVQDLGKLPATLARRTHAPAYVYLAPGVCERAVSTPVSPAPTSPDGSSTTSTTSTSTSATTNPAPASAAAPGCPAGQPSGAAAQDAFLKAWVPKILASPAYRDHGALVIAFTAAAAATHPVRTGALIVSAVSTRHRTVTTTLDPYALLRAGETALGLEPLADAKGAPVADLFPSAHPSERTRSAGHHS